MLGCIWMLGSCQQLLGLPLWFYLCGTARKLATSCLTGSYFMLGSNKHAMEQCVFSPSCLIYIHVIGYISHRRWWHAQKCKRKGLKKKLAAKLGRKQCRLQSFYIKSAVQMFYEEWNALNTFVKPSDSLTRQIHRARLTSITSSGLAIFHNRSPTLNKWMQKANSSTQKWTFLATAYATASHLL